MHVHIYKIAYRLCMYKACVRTMQISRWVMLYFCWSDGAAMTMQRCEEAAPAAAALGAAVRRTLLGGGEDSSSLEERGNLCTALPPAKGTTTSSMVPT